MNWNWNNLKILTADNILHQCTQTMSRTKKKKNETRDKNTRLWITIAIVKSNQAANSKNRIIFTELLACKMHRNHKIGLILIFTWTAKNEVRWF